MSIPLDRLYDFLDQEINHDMVIYHWFPHGSKKLNDFKLYKDYHLLYGKDSPVFLTKPILICHDQEPLDFDRFSRDDLSTTWVEFLRHDDPGLEISEWKTVHELVGSLNLQLLTWGSIYPAILLHSERNSKQVGKYQDHGFVTCYYWSHALISRDWFRYAEHDNLLNDKKPLPGLDFLIYNRAWSGTREYRLFFTQLLIDNGLHDSCRTWFNPRDGIHYSQHKFENQNFKLSRYDLENFFKETTAPSTSSGDYCREDYSTRTIEIVLETLFDDTRNHLTEKILRPIACGHPFMLAGPANSLEYLRSYGFETYQGLINEDYDSIFDPVKRLVAIVKEMQRISNLEEKEKVELFRELFVIAKRNRSRFFSTEFSLSIVQEFKDNIKQAIKESKSGPDLEKLSLVARFLREHHLDGADKLTQSITFLYNHPNFLREYCSHKIQHDR